MGGAGELVGSPGMLIRFGKAKQSLVSDLSRFAKCASKYRSYPVRQFSLGGPKLLEGLAWWSRWTHCPLFCVQGNGLCSSEGYGW